jgi:hypothetical protein
VNALDLSEVPERTVHELGLEQRVRDLSDEEDASRSIVANEEDEWVIDPQGDRDVTYTKTICRSRDLI